MHDILVVDDDKLLASMLVQHLTRNGYRAESASSLNEGLRIAKDKAIAVVFLDVQLPDGNGLEALNAFTSLPSKPEIIIITGAGDPYGARKAIDSGAWSYLEKPHVVRDLLLPLTRAIEYREHKFKVGNKPVLLNRDAIVGNSHALRNCLDQVANAVSSQANVLITGETGTGKEVFANVIHKNSNRKENNFVVVDCAALPEQLIESTLFGHVKGAFTGANKDHSGLVKLANGGTLFLDEVGELPLELQKRLLRVLQERKFRPIGASKEEESDFRLLAATNRDLEKCVLAGTFRSDLLYRLKSITIELPPLRERKEDINPLTRFFLTRFCDRSQVEYKGFSSEFFDHLEAHDWPGNVRELQQTLEQVFATAYHFPKLFAYHLPRHLRISKAQNVLQEKNGDKKESPTERDRLLLWKDYKQKQELNYWQELMSFCRGNIPKACEVSGLSRARLYQMLKKYSD